MKSKFVLYLPIILILIFNSVTLIGVNGKTTEIVSVELDKLDVIEDRDIGAGEIYVKYIVNNGTPQFSKIYKNIIDGDILNLNLYMIANGNFSNYSLRIEVWESDNRYSEGDNDFLGYVEINKVVSTNSSVWFSAEGSIGGDNNIQARLVFPS